MTSQWVAKRKMLYGTIGIVVLATAVGLPLYFFLHKTPTCSDRIKNQNEKGVDCGGVCNLLCPTDIVNPIVLWQRAFPVTPGIYNAVAYIQNPNVLTRVDKITYVFRLYDKNNLMIGERTGTTFIPANQTFAVFEAGIRTGERIPVRTSFAFTDTLSWSQNLDTYKKPSLLSENVLISNESVAPRLDAVIRNKSLETVDNLEAVTIIYDIKDNAIAASRTIVQNLLPGTGAPVTFTWPGPFSDPVARKEMILRIYPAGSNF